MRTDPESEILSLLERALALPPQARDAWLSQQTAGADALARVRALLQHEATASGFLALPPRLDGSLDASLPAPGSRIGAWELERELGAGGMGVVYLARRADRSYEQRAAIKFVRIDPLLPRALRDERVQRFENERRLLARLDHPDIARVLDGGRTAQGVPWLAMEYVDGESLLRHCDRAGLDLRARLLLFRRVCDAVQAAHRHLIVHRDLKPQNILVDRDGAPRLLDFGIARLLEHGDEEPLRTSGEAMTPAYASPEQLRREPLTTASDVYSLGVVLFELVSGTRPFTLGGLSPAQSERLVCETAPPTLRAALAGGELLPQERQTRLRALHDDVERIVARAMHKDPALRYASAQALSDDIARHLDGRPVLAHPDSLRYRTGKFLRRHRSASLAAAIALLAVLAAAAIAAWQWQQARRAAADTASMNAFLLDVMQMSNPYSSGSEVSLGDALDEAATLVDTRFAGRPDLATTIRLSLGENLHARYRLDAAEALLRRAAADAERLFGRDDERSARALASLASVVKDGNRQDEAQALFDEALRRFERGGHRASPLYGSVLNDVGVMHLMAQDFATAQSYLQRALDAHTGSDAERARTLANLAQAARGLDQLDRAEQLYAQAQPVLERAYPDGGPHLAVLLNNRARLAWARDRRDEAIALQKQAVAMHRRSFRGDHVMILVPMTNLARMALDHGDTALGASWAGQAVAMADRMYAAQPHPYHVNALAALVVARRAQARVRDAIEVAARMQAVLARIDDVPDATRSFAQQLIADLCNEPSPAPLQCPSSLPPDRTGTRSD